MTPAEIDMLVDAIVERLSDRMRGADEIIDARGAAELLGISLATLERRVRAKQIPSFRIGRLRKFKRSELLLLSDRE